MMGLKVGDPREVDHIKPLSKGGSNSKRNLRIVSRKTNRRKGAKYNAGGGKYKGGKRIKQLQENFAEEVAKAMNFKAIS